MDFEQLVTQVLRIWLLGYLGVMLLYLHIADRDWWTTRRGKMVRIGFVAMVIVAAAGWLIELPALLVVFILYPGLMKLVFSA